MKRILVTLIILSFFINTAICQFGTIKGILFDRKNNKGIGFANIWIKEIKKYTNTDTLGKFNFDSVPIGKYDLSASFVGYGDTTIKGIYITKDTIINLKIILPPPCVYDKNIHDKTCPICKKKNKVIPILYGLPIGKLNEEKYYYAGCNITTCQPNWYCKRDKTKF